MPQTIDHRRAELMKAGERKLHLGLDARGPSNQASRSAGGQIIEQRGLADSRLASENKGSTLPGQHARDDAIERFALVTTTP